MDQYFYDVQEIQLGPIQARDNQEHERLIQITDQSGRVSRLRLVSACGPRRLQLASTGQDQAR